MFGVASEIIIARWEERIGAGAVPLRLAQVQSLGHG